MAQKKHFRIIILLVLLVLLLPILIKWFLLKEVRPHKDIAQILEAPEHSTENIDKAKLHERSNLPEDPQEQVNALTPSGTSKSKQHESNPSELSQWLPDWLREGGSHLQDRREINGHTVLRSRGRIEWDTGEYLEIEITDAGTAADKDLFKSLGVDLLLENTERENGFTMTQDEDGYLVNHEYDLEDQSGNMQVIIEGRYLIEIQVEQLSEEAFQEVLDIDIPFEAIFKQLDVDQLEQVAP